VRIFQPKKLLKQPEKQSVKKCSFHPWKGIHCWFFLVFFWQKVKQGWLDGQTSTMTTTATTLTTFFINARHLVPSPATHNSVSYMGSPEWAQGGAKGKEKSGGRYGKQRTALAAIVSLAWAAAACRSGCCYRLYWVMAVVMVAVAELGWKLCVFLCHIPIYINLVFAMTDDICQCQTFSFSISASNGRSEFESRLPVRLSACPCHCRQGCEGPGYVAVPGLKVTCQQVSPRPQRPLLPSSISCHNTTHGRRPTHEFDEFDVKYFRCFPHFFMKSIFPELELASGCVPLGHLLPPGVDKLFPPFPLLHHSLSI